VSLPLLPCVLCLDLLLESLHVFLLDQGDDVSLYPLLHPVRKALELVQNQFLVSCLSQDTDGILVGLLRQDEVSPVLLQEEGQGYVNSGVSVAN
jgi:hypothetical protein